VTSALDWTKRLVSLDTTSRGSNRELIDLVAGELRRHGLTPTILPNGDGTKANLVVTIPSRDGGTAGGIALSGHTDVVPVDGQAWDTDPFTAQVRDGRLYGRGTCDMKSFIGAILATLPHIARAKLREPVHIVLSYDEELGCLGAANMVQQLAGLGVRPATCIVGEPTGMRVIAGHKSINLLELTVHGVAAHSSLTPQGVNAIEYASRAIGFIRSLAEEFRAQGPFDEAYDVPYTTASVNVVDGGTAANIVADRCRAEFEFRSIGSVDPAKVRARIQAYCDELQQTMRQENALAGVELRTLAMVPGLDTDAASPAIRLGELLGGVPSARKVTYGTEAGLFRAAGTETIVCGPGEIDQAHTANEFVELGQIRACETFLDNLVQHLSTASPTTASPTTPSPTTPSPTTPSPTTAGAAR
jgi:acetylornithine deacetylase